VRLVVDTEVISTDQGTFAKMLHSKNHTECVCVNSLQLKHPGTEYKDENLSTNYQA